MTLEFILWLVAWVVISEGIFIFLLIKNHTGSTWVGKKFISFIAGGFFIVIQTGIVFSDGGKVALFGTAHYIRLVYEAIVLGVVGVLFLINWLISKKIEKRNEKKDEEYEKERKKKMKQEEEDWIEKIGKIKMKGEK